MINNMNMTSTAVEFTFMRKSTTFCFLEAETPQLSLELETTKYFVKTLFQQFA